MSDILERLAEMERDAVKSIPPHAFPSEIPERIAAAIHRHTMLVAREAHVEGCRYVTTPSEQNESRLAAWRTEAMRRFPLPPRKVLREEPDPHGLLTKWRYTEGGLQLSTAGEPWVPAEPSGLWTPTPARIRLWHGLLTNPYREEAE